MHRARILLSVAAVVVMTTTTSCGGGEVSKSEFLDHAVEVSTAAKTSEERAAMREIYDCVWPELSKNQQLLEDFMDSEEPTPELSASISKLMGPCIMAGVTTTTAPPAESTAPPAS